MSDWGASQRCRTRSNPCLHSRPHQFERKYGHSAFELRTVSQFERRCPKRLRASGALSRVQQTVRRAPGGHCQTVRIRGQVSPLSKRNTVSRVRQGRLAVPACLVSYFVHRRSPLRRQGQPIEQRVRASYPTEISRSV